jgi:hypothetical protein
MRAVKPGVALGGVVIALLLGIAVGYGLHGGHRAPVPTVGGAFDDGGRSAGAPGPGSAPAIDAPPRQAVALPEIESARPGDTAANAHARLIEALRGLPLPPPEQGDGVITGQVQDRDGRPVEGVTLWLEAVAPSFQRRESVWSNPPPEAEEFWRRLAEGTTRAAAQAAARTHPSRRTSSASDGTFQFGGLPQVQFRVYAFKEDWRFHSAPSFVEPGTPVMVQGQRIPGVEIEVYLPDGSPAETCRITAEMENSSAGIRAHLDWHRESNRVFKLSAASWALTADAGSDLRGFARVQVKEAGRVIVRIDLKWRTTIRGRVVFGDAQPVDGVFVHYVSLGDEAPDAMLWETDLATTTMTRVTRDRTGYFTLPDVAAGFYVVRATLGYAGRVLTETTVRVADGPADCELRIEPPEFDLRVPVEAPESFTATTEITIQFRTLERPPVRPEVEIWRDQDTFLLLITQSKPEPGHHVELQARCWEYGTRRVSFVFHPGMTVPVRFEVPALLQLTLENTKPQATANLRFEATEEDGASVQLHAKSQTDPNDLVVRFHPAQPGVYRVAARLADGHNSFVLAESTVVLRPGVNQAVLRLASLHNLSIDASALPGAAWVRLQPRDRLPRYAPSHSVQPAKPLLIPQIPAGAYTLAYGSGRGEPKTIDFDVPATTTVYLTP